ncbi:MAG: hypothetical protein NC254_07695 [bacterium]|nr:hypothetical protein [bacterium]
MGKDTRLVNIYLKIHHKKNLTMDDLAYLAEYDPECFAKTCQNVVYNIPETKPIMEPPAGETTDDAAPPGFSERQSIEKILENLKRLERNEFPHADADADRVKELLGNLYMEMLFPHDDKETFMNMADTASGSLFDQKA